MAQFDDPFQITVTPDLCDNNICPECTPGPTPSIDDCVVCGYPSGIFETCQSASTPCLDGAVICLDCESSFVGDIKFLGGYVSGFSSKLGFGASESTVNIDIVLPKTRCPDPTISSPVGVCCEPDQSCSSLYSGQEDCENAGGVWFSDKSCADNPCSCPECEQDPKYEGKLGYIYTFNIGAFCFRGILNNHNYTEDSSGYKYRITLVDGRSVLNNTVVLLNGVYVKLPNEFASSAISIGASEESVVNNTCGTGNQCVDFMTTGSGSTKGVKIKSALQAINGKCVSIPVSNAGLNINVTKLINVISDEIRTSNTESTVLELITLACEESGYDFLVSINNNNEFDILPVNYKRPATDKSLFNFIEDLSAKDIVISKDYGEEMAGTSSKNKRIVFGNNLSYITSVRDYPLQQYAKPEQELDLEISPVCCYIEDNYITCEDTGELTLPSVCEAAGGTWYPNSSCVQEGCLMQPPCTIKNNPASISAYDTFFITPTPYPEGC
jgi:hypothetical protein